MYSRRRVDGNHAEIVAALRKCGCSVQSLVAVGEGCPDLLVGAHRLAYVLEVKDGSLPPSRRQLTPLEAEWHANWRGHVAIVKSIEEALKACGLR